MQRSAGKEQKNKTGTKRVRVRKPTNKKKKKETRRNERWKDAHRLLAHGNESGIVGARAWGGGAGKRFFSELSIGTDATRRVCVEVFIERQRQ